MNHSCPQDFTVPPASRNVERFRRPRYHVDVRRTGGERRCWLALRDAFAVCLLLPRRRTQMLVSVAGCFCSMFVVASIFFCAGFAKKVARMCHLTSKCVPAYLSACLLSLAHVTIRNRRANFFEVCTWNFY